MWTTHRCLDTTVCTSYKILHRLDMQNLRPNPHPVSHGASSRTLHGSHLQIFLADWSDCGLHTQCRVFSASHTSGSKCRVLDCRTPSYSPLLLTHAWSNKAWVQGLEAQLAGFVTAQGTKRHSLSAMPRHHREVVGHCTQSILFLHPWRYQYCQFHK